MKYNKPFYRTILLLLVSFLAIKAYSQDIPKIDKKHIRDSLKKAKAGFAWGGTPILAYDSDLGLRYGLVINLFDYGKKSLFPKYLQYAKVRAFNSTKGTSTVSVVFDSDKFFKKTKLISEASFINDIALNFYGFNGKQSNFNQQLINPANPLYENKFFYNHQRQWLRGRVDLQHRLNETNFRLLLGATFNLIILKPINHNVLDVPAGPNGEIPTNESLYKYYGDWGVIHENEIEGGSILHTATGITYDSRNNAINCKEGIWFETYLLYSPKVQENPNFAKHILTYRQYATLTQAEIMLQYRISSQQKLWGNIPFYYLPVFFDSQMNQDGLGGAFTLRGISRNRVVSDGFMLGNVEVRKKIMEFPIKKLNFEIEISAFVDASYTTQKYDANYENIPTEYHDLLLTNSTPDYYLTYGPGLYIIYNVNNIISANLGFSNDEQLGVMGLYIGSSFLF